jgi:hypothetical protein
MWCLALWAAFEVGVDYGTSVDTSVYQPPFPFTPAAALEKAGLINAHCSSLLHLPRLIPSFLQLNDII